MKEYDDKTRADLAVSMAALKPEEGAGINAEDWHKACRWAADKAVEALPTLRAKYSGTAFVHKFIEKARSARKQYLEELHAQ